MSKRRPWKRTVIKLGASLFGARRRHYADWWPHLKLEKSLDKTTIVYRDDPISDLSTLDVLRRRVDGDIVIVGSGPSINQTAVERLQARSAILLNGAVSLSAQRIVSPLAVAFEDERFIWRHFAMVRRCVDPETPMMLSVSVIRALCEIEPRFLRDKQIHLIDNLRKPYGRPRPSDAELARLPFVVMQSDYRYGFSRNPDAGIFMSHSIAVSALQFAIACTPAAIKFAGIDLTNDTQPRFYEEMGKAEPSGLSGSLEYILGHIDLAKTCAAASGIAFSNYSPTSALSRIGIEYNSSLTREL